MTSDRARLQSYVDAWTSAVDDVVALLRALPEEDWARPTDCPGWDVRAVAAHLAHLESVQAGGPQPGDGLAGPPELGGSGAVTGGYTQQGLAARAAMSPAEIVDELASSSARWRAELREHPPTDGSGAPPRTPGGIGWSWETLLSNRPLDVWMHEQDIRRAVGRPGGLDSLAARHTVRVFARGLGFVVGKRVAPPSGTSVVLDVTGPHPLHAALGVGDDGRAKALPEDPADPTVTLRMGLESYVVLCGGRRPVPEVDVEVVGDTALGRRVLEALAVTP